MAEKDMQQAPEAPEEAPKIVVQERLQKQFDLPPEMTAEEFDKALAEARGLIELPGMREATENLAMDYRQALIDRSKVQKDDKGAVKKMDAEIEKRLETLRERIDETVDGMDEIKDKKKAKAEILALIAAEMENQADIAIGEEYKRKKAAEASQAEEADMNSVQAPKLPAAATQGRNPMKKPAAASRE